MKIVIKTIFRILAVVATLCVVALVAGKFWVIPASIRQRVRRAVGEYWNGRVEIGRVDFAYTGPLTLKDVRLLGPNSKEWLRIDNLTATLRDWPGSMIPLGGTGEHPVLTDLEVRRPVVRAHFIDGKCEVPARELPGEAGELLEKYVDLSSVKITGGRVVYVDRAGQKDGLKEMSLTLQRSGGEVRVLASGRGAGGTFRLAGPLAQKADGTYELRNWSLEAPGGTLSDNLRATVEVRRDERRLIVRDVSAGVGGGRVDGNVILTLDLQKGVSYVGQVRAEGVSMSRFARKFAVSKPPTRGRLEGEVFFSGRNADLYAIGGGGWVFMNDSDVSNFALFGEVWEFAGLGKIEPLRRSDLLARFRLTGPVMVIQKARLTNSLAAFDAQPGGKIDLYNRRLDMYVIAAALNEIRRVLDLLPIPFLKSTTSFTEKLMRLRIKGRWSDPPGKLIRKEPLKDLQEGFAVFVQQSVRSGGQISRQAVEPLKKMFESLTTKPAK